MGLTDAICKAANAGGTGRYVDGHKECIYACTNDKRKIATVTGGCRGAEDGGGDGCYGVPYHQALAGGVPGGAVIYHPGDPKSFSVDTNSLLDKYFKYDKKLLNNIDKKLGK